MQSGDRNRGGRHKTGRFIGLLAAIFSGLSLVLIGCLAFYGAPALGGFLPFSPAGDRHPEAQVLLMDIRKAFQDYQTRSGALYAAGQSLMRKHALAYLRLESHGGAAIHRSYDPARIDYERVQWIETELADLPTVADQTPKLVPGLPRYYAQKHRIQILRDADAVEDVTVSFAYEKLYIGARRFANLFGIPHTISRSFYLRFSDLAPYMAGLVIALGLLLVFLSVRGLKKRPAPRRIFFADETWPDPNRPLPHRLDDAGESDPGDDSAALDPLYADNGQTTLDADGEAAVRILSDPTGFLFTPPLSTEEEGQLRRKLAAYARAGDIERYEFEQERWNLPGFQSVMQPLRRRVQASDIDFAARHFAHSAGGTARGFDNQSSLFDFRYYRYHELPAYPEQIADVESYAKAFLTAVTDIIGHATATLFLRNRRGRYHATLRRAGQIFISGTALGEGPLSDSKLIEQLEDGRYVVMEEGREVYFPVPSRQGVLGMMRLASERPLYNSEALSRAWYEIRKFGESLFQARVFDEATGDPESTLFNGLCFHRDLLYEFSLKHELIHPRMLTLLRFRGRSNPESARIFGLGLRAFFGPPQRLYRVAADVFAVLGPELPLTELERRVAEFLAYVREQEAVDVNAGCAPLADDGAGPASPYEWFRQAGLALEQCEKLGLNRLRLYESAAGAPTAFRAMRSRSED